MSEPLLVVDDLRVRLPDGTAIVDGVDLQVDRGRALGLVGESGCGKTTTLLALLGYTRFGAAISGSVRVRGEELVGRDEKELRALRGRLIAYVPQEPAMALNPSMRVEGQLRHVLQAHGDVDSSDAVVDSLNEVHLPTHSEFRRRYPHQLSGGQQQRLAIAIALLGRPALLALDEPTTGLDVVTQARVLEEVASLRDNLGIGLVYVSHNLAAVAGLADDLAVMYAGRVVETGQVKEVVSQPRHPYTRSLILAIPDVQAARHLEGIPGAVSSVVDRPPGCAFAPRCSHKTNECEVEVPSLEMITDTHATRCLHWTRVARPVVCYSGNNREAESSASSTSSLTVDGLTAEHRTREGVVVAVNNVSFTLESGSCLALVGESGSGKTSIARCIAGLYAPTNGTIQLDGISLPPSARKRDKGQRRRIQIVFQNPYDSLNPRHTVRESIGRPARLLRGLKGDKLEDEVVDLLARVRLPRSLAGRYPPELSGGERQRVAIARALAASPDFLVCDEITSALDVSVQATVLNLLRELRQELGLAILLITHDLGVVANMADRILVLQGGVLCEQGLVSKVIGQPSDDYTKKLIESTPRLIAGA